ncbi:MAG: translocation/assembly module TamB domain-containing protein [Prevotella sp.]|nr:translocation/assembly module TamB domain-containing protein [Prevotella sp.]
MKRVLKWISIVLLSPVVLFIVLVALLYVPPIQNWVVQRVASVASEKSGMDISVEHVDLSFPLDLVAEGVRIVKDNDTIADIRRSVVDVKLWPLLSGNIVLDELRIDDAHVNTIDFIGDLRMKGYIGSLSLSSPGIDAAAMEMQLQRPRLSRTDLTIYMSDTAAVDTSTVGWHILFDRFDFDDTRLCIVMDSTAVFATDASPADSAITVPLRITASLPKATLHQGDLHLGLVRFAFGAIDWHEGSLTTGSYGRDSYNTVALSGMELQLDSLFSYKDELRVGIAQASLREDSLGLTLHQLQGGLAKKGDDLSVHRLKASASTQWEEHPVTLHASIDGDMHQMDIERLSVSVPMMAHAEVSGRLHNLLDLEHLTGNMSLEAQVFQTIKADDLQLPGGTSLQADLQALANQTTADITMRQGRAQATMKATVEGPLTNLTDHPDALRYDARLSTRALDLRRFMPSMGVGPLSTDITLRGNGIPTFDAGSANSGLVADIQLHSVSYDQWQIDSVEATATVEGQHLQLCAVSHNSLVDGSFDVDALMGKGNVVAKVSTNLKHADLYALGIMDHPTVVGLNGDFDIDTDTKLHHRLSALMTDLYIRDSVQTHHPERIGILLRTSSDTTVVRLQSGDFIVKGDAQGSYEQLLPQLSMLADSIADQLSHHTIDQPALKRLLPTGRLYITCKKGNPIATILNAQAGITFDQLDIDLHASPLSGLNGQMDMLKLNTGSMLLDSIRLSLVEKTHGLTFNGSIINGKRNTTGTFRILYDGLLQQHGASLGVRYFDDQDRLNIRIGSKVEMVSLPGADGDATGLRFQLIPSRPTLGYKEFALNDDNYLLLHDNLRIEANVDLMADDGTRIQIYSGDSEDRDDGAYESHETYETHETHETHESHESHELLQDLTISVSSLDLGELTSGLVMLPAISGTLNGDYHLMMDQDHSISVASDMSVTQMAYEGSPIGNLGSEFVYLLREDGTHVVDATMMLDDAQIGTLQGSYLDGKRLDAVVELTHMPLAIVNGFMPDQLLGFEGFADGTFSVNGPMSNLDMDGRLTFTDGYLVSTPYGMRMRFGDKPLQMTDSKLVLDGFTLYADNDAAQSSPLTFNGNVDFYGKGSDAVSLRLSARNFHLVNAKQKKESVAYGRMFVNFFARLTGNLDKLNLRGRLDVLGTTDLNYILLDSPLSTDSQLDELVKFTDFSDTTQTVVVTPETDALDLDVQLNIDEGAHVRCALNADQTNYVDLLGGGDLRLRMDADGMNLTGRYTINSGTMKYSLPVIPLKTFTLAQGSYVEFTGQPDNPTLNITATERHRAAVSNESDGQSRNVVFDCGVVITQTLENMGLAFTINAPEDMQVQNELNSMSHEQRGKLAVTMLTTGMYLADGNTSAFSMNSALSSFLQSEINNITAGALKTVDLQVGLGSSIDAAGQSHTDYSFSFAKRFWNNRLNVQIGGKVSSGAEVEGMQQSFFDNVTMEYRLSATSNKYLKLFYNQNVYDWLEGYTGEYGGGFVWKRKLDRLIDIFRKTRNVRMRTGSYSSRTGMGLNRTYGSGSPRDSISGSPRDSINGSPRDSINGSPRDSINGSPQESIINNESIK